MKYFTFLFVSLVFGLQMTTAQESQLWKSKVDPVVLSKIEGGQSTDFMIIMHEQADLSAAYHLETKEQKGAFTYKRLVETAQRTQEDVIRFLNAQKATYRSFWVINGIYAQGDIKTVQTLAQFASVKNIIENASYTYHKPIVELAANDGQATRAIEWGLTKVKADQVWALGHKGKGAVIGGQDTGYDWDHAAIKKQYRGWNASTSTAEHDYNWHDAIKTGNGGTCGTNAKAPCDDDQHGTHTMGTMVGDDGGSNKVGMAPEAKWIGCRNMDVGVGKFSTYMDCWEWFLAPTNLNGSSPDTKKAPDVINNSWGCPTSEGCNSSNFKPMETAVENLRAAGVVVVVSAGNDGSGCGSINTPAAIYEGSFSVGNTTSSDAIASSSSRGAVTVDGSNRLKPNVSAPGTNIRSCVPGTGYASLTGTSMAGPHVAGLVALIISANPALKGKVKEIEDIIESTALKLTSTQSCNNVSGSTIPNNTFGFGRIDALAAVKKALLFTSSGTSAAKQTRVDVFPNPASNKVTFMLNELDQPITFELYSVTGQRLLSEQWEPSKLTRELNIAALAPGIYFYKLENETTVLSGKLIRQE